MKQLRTLWMLAAILFAGINVSAQKIIPLDENAMYFTADELQDPQRAQQAIDNVVVDVAEMAEQFSVPFGMEISREKTPAIFHVLYRGMLTSRLAARKPKLAYQRMRPYVRFQESTLIPEEEEALRNNGSYPSGHSIRGWAMALLLCEINPDAQDAILKLGYEWGQSRVIVGYHWQSDVDASRLLGSSVFARLHTNPQFLADMAAARKEFARLKDKK